MRVLITGGTGSIGQQLVLAFRRHNHDVIFQYHTQMELAKQLEKVSGAHCYQADFTSGLVELPTSEIDVLINGAAVNISANLTASVTELEWTTTLCINLSAPFFLVRAVLPSMIKNGFGRIINIGSIYSTRVVEKNLPYSVSKHGLSGLTKTVAREYGRWGITCNEICPGPVNSRLMNEIAERNAPVLHISSDEYLHRIADSIPVPRLAQPTDIAAAALFLASAEASYLNGLSLTLDGGFTT